MNTYEQYTQYIQNKTATDLDIVSTGFWNLDQYFAHNGLQKDILLTIPGKSGVGKTHFATGMAINISKNGKKVLFFSLEMGFNSVMDRFNQVVSGVHISELHEYLKENEKENIEDLTNMGFFDNITIYDEPVDVFGIDKMIGEIKPDIVFIDHLHLIKCKYMDIFPKTTYLMGMLKDIKKKHQARIVLLVQVKRGENMSKDAGAIPGTLEAAKGSGAIEEDSDAMLTIGRPNMNPACEHDRKNTIEGLIRKNRFPAYRELDLLRWRYDRKTGRLTEIM